MHDQHPERYATRPGTLLAMVWGVVLLMSFYGADVVRDEVEKSELLAEQAWLVDGLTAVMKAGDAIGLSALKEGLAGARETINDKYAILEQPAPVVVPPVQVALPKEVEPAPDEGPAVRHRGPLRPKRVLVIGASSIQFAIGGELEARIPEYEGVTVKRYGKLATGLSRPDFFDWPKKFRELAASFRPDLVIANFGGNGAQSIPTGKYDKAKWGTKDWDAVYAQKVTEMVEIADGAGAEMVFLGMPVMRSGKFTKKMKHLNRVQAEAAREAGAMFVSTFAMSSTSRGAYRKTIRIGSKRGLMRTSDGVHYTKLGAKYVVAQALQEIERRYALVPADEALAVAEGHAFASPTLERDVEYVAYVPRGEGDRPAVLLFPDPDEDWSTWPNWPHRALQRAAQEAGAVLVVVKTPPEGWWVGELLDVLAEELLADVQAHLPVREVSVAGAGAGSVAALGLAFRAPDRVRGVSLFGGPLDLLAEARGDAALRALLGDPGEHPERWKAASPGPAFDPERHGGLRFQIWGGGAGFDGLGTLLESSEASYVREPAQEGSWSKQLPAVVQFVTAAPPDPSTN